MTLNKLSISILIALTMCILLVNIAIAGSCASCFPESDSTLKYILKPQSGGNASSYYYGQGGRGQAGAYQGNYQNTGGYPQWNYGANQWRSVK
jgi:hypothetical protein